MKSLQGLVPVELIGERPELEAFCQKHAAMLFGKVVVYEKLERWEVGALVATDASPPDVDEEAA